jgi:hypothetical protein
VRDRARPFTTVLRRARRVGAHAVLRDGRVVRVARGGCAHNLARRSAADDE